MTELEANYKSFQLSKLFPTEVNKIPLLPLTNTTVQNEKKQIKMQKSLIFRLFPTEGNKIQHQDKFRKCEWRIQNHQNRVVQKPLFLNSTTHQSRIWFWRMYVLGEYCNEYFDWTHSNIFAIFSRLDPVTRDHLCFHVLHVTLSCLVALGLACQ